MSIKAYQRAWEADIKPAVKLTLLALADFANDQYQCYPSIGRLAEMTGKSNRQISRDLAYLVAEKYLSLAVGRGRSNTNMYTLLAVKHDTHDMFNEVENMTPMTKNMTPMSCLEDRKHDTHDQKHDTHVMFNDEQEIENMTPTSCLNQENMTPMTIKHDMGVMGTVKNRNIRVREEEEGEEPHHLLGGHIQGDDLQTEDLQSQELVKAFLAFTHRPAPPHPTTNEWKFQWIPHLDQILSAAGGDLTRAKEAIKAAVEASIQNRYPFSKPSQIRQKTVRLLKEHEIKEQPAPSKPALVVGTGAY